MNQDNSDQVQFWSSHVGEKWARRQAELDGLMQPVLDGILARAALRAGDRVLDIGCGAGAASLAAAERVGSSGAVLGVDVSPPLLDLARSRAAGLPQVTFHHGDAATLDLDRPFDRLISRFGVMFFADPVAGFAQMERQITPGGRLSVATWGQIPDNPFFTLPARAARQTLGSMPKSDPDAPGPFAMRDPDRVTQILQEAGWASVDCAVETLTLTPEGGADALAEQMCEIGPAGGAITYFQPEPAQIKELQQAIAEALADYVQNGEVRLPAQINFVTATKP
ncbi:methyltransferase domain-containing protein [Sulfitobacter sp. S0837]|uniref:class I SAM-dependent methyltransferase n=1 Tax=Sulfitobacter maritimus TaxID=2741719 RepID=UPI0015832D06|nr:methyltransferase domain-containing protein [Sulfitobacter maritimus]NUH64189.1 methyltransferase domain-containing protein [Sulfitobacter maritimus]